MVGRILVVDDEESIRRLVARALEEEGHEVVALGDPRLALEIVKERPVDLVVTNNQMPGMTGAQLIRALRQRHPRLPAVHLDDASTVNSSPHHVEEDVVTIFKPFSLEALQKTVRDLLSNP